jgi:transcriptional regulator with XRE-family HTH domain
LTPGQIVDRLLLYRLLGERIQRARFQNCKSQRVLAEELGMSRTSMVNIEKGRQHTSIHVLWQIAERLNVEAAALLPTRRDYLASNRPVVLDRVTIEKINRKAKDDPDTKRQLEEFVKWAKARDTSARSSSTG